MGSSTNLGTPGSSGSSGPASILSNISTNPSSGVSNVSQAPLAIKKLDHTHSSITKMKEPLDESNWVVWHKRIRRIFRLCGVEPYVYGNLKCPDPAIDLGTCDIWDNSDVYAQILITNNITKEQMVHVTRLNTAHKIWKSLQAIHETKDYQIAISIQRTLFRKCASDGDDIVEHLTQLK